MKLYTEEQVKEAIKMAKVYTIDNEVGFYHKNSEYEIMMLLTPIELPCDEEIEKGVNCSNLGLRYDFSMSAGFKKGAKWMRDLINGNNKLTL